VYGYAFTGETMRKSPLRPTGDSGYIKILCAHAHLNSPLSPYCPISTAELEACGFNYAALGHVHNAPEASEAGSFVYAYCGCLEGRGYDETGPKGAIYAEVSDDGKVTLKRHIFSSRKYEVRRLNVTGAASCSEITEKVKSLIRDENMDDTTILRIILEGAVPPALVISPESISRGIGEVFALDIKDTTSPIYGGEYLESDPTIRGEFYRQLLPMLTSADERERTVASLALRCGLAAMAGENISISTAN
jgi:DNA repair exonuclease SbcCD nuclease subunit